MRPFPVRLLNKTADIRRPDQSITTSGDLEQTLVTLSTGVKIRIVDNDKEVTYGRTIEQGELVVGTHHGFTLPGVDVKKGDFISCDHILYKVMYVEKNPGGITNHHIEIYLERVD